MLDLYYESTTNLSLASVAVIYVGNAFSHAGRYDPTTGKFYGKGGVRETREWDNEYEFRRGYETNPQEPGDY